MLKIFIKVFLVFCILLSFSCTAFPSINNSFDSAIVDEGNFLNISYYNVDKTLKFREFLRSDNKDNIQRSVYNGNIKNIDEAFSFTWQKLSDKDKKIILENIDNVNLTCEYGLSINKDSDIVRAAIDDNDYTSIENAKIFYLYNAKLDDWFEGKTIPFGLIENNKLKKGFECLGSDKLIPCSNVVKLLSSIEDWENIDKILKYVESDINIEKIKDEYYNIESSRTDYEETTQNFV